MGRRLRQNRYGTVPYRLFILVGWIRIRIRIGNTDPDTEGPKMTHKSEENSSFEVLDFSIEE
jgi:hypothetical protein